MLTSLFEVIISWSYSRYLMCVEVIGFLYFSDWWSTGIMMWIVIFLGEIDWVVSDSGLGSGRRVSYVIIVRLIFVNVAVFGANLVESFVEVIVSHEKVFLSIIKYWESILILLIIANLKLWKGKRGREWAIVRRFKKLSWRI